MGLKNSHPPSDFELDVLARQTGLDQFTLRGLFDEFSKNSKKGLMNKKQFRKVYSSLTPGEDPEGSFKLRRIANRVFKAFDRDKSGSLSFDEFVAAYYMLQTRGQARKKMEFLLQQINPQISQSNEAPVMISKRDTRRLLDGMDAGLGVSRSSATMTMLDTQQAAEDPQPTSYSVTNLIDTVVNDPVYMNGFEKASASLIMNNPADDNSDF